MSCALCGAVEARQVRYPGAEAEGARRLGLSAIALCAGCGFGRAAPCPGQGELDRFYASGAYWGACASIYQMAHERVQAGMRVERCAPLLPVEGGLHVLDVGAGHGFIAERLERALGARIESYDFIEPDASAARRVLSRAGAFPRQRLEGIEALPSARYDLLFLNHVLEHVADPEAFLRSFRSRLKPGAIAYVETPLADHRFKEDVFPHVLFFTPDAFRALGKRIDVETLAIEAFGRLPRAGSGQQIGGKLANVAFGIAVRSGSRLLQEAIDRAIWGYGVQLDGVWLRWIFRRGSSPG